MKLVWHESAWTDHLWWQTQDRKVLERINALLQDVVRNGNESIGKPEPLRRDLHGYWSRRISEEHRLIHRVTEDEVRTVSRHYHYGR
ncbi:MULTISPECIES: Txe/YoeB family addiction module toxin [Streptomycetaceae]|uniref:Txe/YoeB family addiction module toxin n=1 Tax=unclassified Streptomyces TaxID=2593676 RepID=UPI00338B2D0C